MQYIHGGDIYSNKGVLDFSANINPKGMPQSVTRAAKEGVEASFSYPDYACRKLRDALADFFNGINNSNLLPENIICANGAAEIIFSLVRALKPKKALLFAPTFAEYEQALLAVDCEIDYYYFKEENGFNFENDDLNNDDLENIDKLVSSSDIMFLCNPNNPTGKLINIDLVRGIIEKCKRYKTMLVVDECFNLFLENSCENTALTEIYENKYLFVINAFTKIFAMPGLRLGFGFSSDMDLLKEMYRQCQPWNVSIPAQMAGVVACDEIDYISKSKELIFTEREYLSKELKRLGFDVYNSDVNFIFFKGKKGLNNELIKKNIMIRDCANFRGLSDGYYRIAVKSHEDNTLLIKVLEEIKWQR